MDKQTNERRWSKWRELNTDCDDGVVIWESDGWVDGAHVRSRGATFREFAQCWGQTPLQVIRTETIQRDDQHRRVVLIESESV